MGKRQQSKRQRSSKMAMLIEPLILIYLGLIVFAIAAIFIARAK